MATWVFNIFKNRAFLGNLFQSWITLTVKKILLCLSVISCISEIWVIPEKVLQCIKFEDLAIRETQDILSNLNNIRCGNWIKWRVHRFIKPVVHIWSKTIWGFRYLWFGAVFPLAFSSTLVLIILFTSFFHGPARISPLLVQKLHQWQHWHWWPDTPSAPLTSAFTKTLFLILWDSGFRSLEEDIYLF